MKHLVKKCNIILLIAVLLITCMSFSIPVSAKQTELFNEKFLDLADGVAPTGFTFTEANTGTDYKSYEYATGVYGKSSSDSALKISLDERPASGTTYRLGLDRNESTEGLFGYGYRPMDLDQLVFSFQLAMHDSIPNIYIETTTVGASNVNEQSMHKGFNIFEISKVQQELETDKWYNIEIIVEPSDENGVTMYAGTTNAHVKSTVYVNGVESYITTIPCVRGDRPFGGVKKTNIRYRTSGTEPVEFYIDNYKFTRFSGGEKFIPEGHMVTLPAVDTPTWNADRKTVSWGNVANNNGYEVKLYRDSTLVTTYTAAKNQTSVDFSSRMKFSGRYTVTVKALGDKKNYKDAEISNPSAGLDIVGEYSMDCNNVLIDEKFNKPLSEPEFIYSSLDRLTIGDDKIHVHHSTRGNVSFERYIVDKNGARTSTSAKFVEFNFDIQGDIINQVYITLRGKDASGNYKVVSGIHTSNVLNYTTDMTSSYTSKKFSNAPAFVDTEKNHIKLLLEKADDDKDSPYTSCRYWINGTELIPLDDSGTTSGVVSSIELISMVTVTTDSHDFYLYPMTLKDNTKKLDNMAAPTWGTGQNARVLHWNAVEDNCGYTICLYREGETTPTSVVTAPKGSVSFDMEQAFSGLGYGRFTATVAAKGDDVYTVSGETSPHSETFLYTTLEADPGPRATNVRVSAGEDGKSLVGTYIYANSDNTPEGASEYRWLICSTETGEYKPIEGETGKTYNLKQSDLKKYIRFEVTPKDTSGNIGDYVRSAAGRPPVLPTAQNVTMSRDGDVLTGSYDYFHFGGINEGNSLFRWLISDTKDGVYKWIPGETSKTLTLKSAQKRKYIKFEVTPVDKTNVKGYAVVTDGMIEANKDTYAIIAANNLVITDLTSESPSKITKNLTLPTKGEYNSTIVWKSNNPALISNTGVVTIPEYGEGKIVSLTATVTAEGISIDKVFKFYVASKDAFKQGKENDSVTYSYDGTALSASDDKTSSIFTDLSSSHWATNYIEALYNAGILSGTGDRRIEPERPIFREEICKIISLAAKLGSADIQMNFKDVLPAEWYYSYILSAYSSGIMKGTNDENFGVGEQLTRQDLAVIMVRLFDAAGITLQDKGNFVDYNDKAEIMDYALESVNKLTSAGILSGDGTGNFAPNAAATRAEVAKLIYSIYFDTK